jgi:hypothetical protein
MAWKLNISFLSESEVHKQEVEKSLDGIFHSTNLRRISTKEDLPEGEVVIVYEDTGVRH